MSPAAVVVSGISVDVKSGMIVLISGKRVDMSGKTVVDTSGKVGISEKVEGTSDIMVVKSGTTVLVGQKSKSVTFIFGGKIARFSYTAVCAARALRRHCH